MRGGWNGLDTRVSFSPDALRVAVAATGKRRVGRARQQIWSRRYNQLNQLNTKVPVIGWGGLLNNKFEGEVIFNGQIPPVIGSVNYLGLLTSA